MATAAVEVCAACSSGVTTKARRFKPTDDAVRSYYTQVQTEWAKLTLPGESEKVQWTVYKLSPPGIFEHYSLFFVCEDKPYNNNGFTFELIVTGEQKYVVTPKTIVRQKKTGTSKLGVISFSARAIIKRGLQCLAEFGDYDEATNNCQHFCSKFAKVLGVEQPWTYSEKIATMVGVGVGVLGAIGAGLAAVVTALGSNKSDHYHNHSHDDDDDDYYMYDDD